MDCIFILPSIFFLIGIYLEFWTSAVVNKLLTHGNEERVQHFSQLELFPKKTRSLMSSKIIINMDLIHFILLVKRVMLVKKLNRVNPT